MNLAFVTEWQTFRNCDEMGSSQWTITTGGGRFRVFPRAPLARLNNIQPTNLGTHVAANKQPTMYRQLKVLQSVLARVIRSCTTHPDVRICNGGLIASVLGHMFIVPSLGNTTTQHSSLTRKYPRSVRERASKCVNTFISPLFHLDCGVAKFQKSPRTESVMKSRCWSVVHIETKEF